MPVEIRELVIRATVAEDGKSGAPPQDSAQGGASPPGEELVKACVDKILEILKDRHGR